MESGALSCSEIAAEWNRCHGAFYQIRESDLLWHLQDQTWLAYEAMRINGVPAFIALATAEGVAAGLSGKTLWVSLYGGVPKGGEAGFFLSLGELASAKGRTRVAIGGEEFHFIPGLPEPDGEALIQEARRSGFQLHEAADFAGTLRTEQVRKYVEEAKSLAGGCRLQTVASETDETLLGEFLLKEFPGRWEREFRFWRQRSDTRHAFWNALVGPEGDIRGFARLAMRGKPGHWVPGALRLPLAEGKTGSLTDSCLGPIGIAASGRGKGHGKVLLGLSLQLLLERGAELVCIDWTNAYNYYQPLGLAAVRKYWSAFKDY